MLTNLDTNSSNLSTLMKLPLRPEFHSNYEIIGELGVGGFGFVVEACHRITHQPVAVKFVTKGRLKPTDVTFNSKLGGLVPNEAAILSSLNHPNIVKFIELYQDDTFFYLVMERAGDSWAKDSQSIWQPRDIFSSIEKDGVFNEIQAQYIFTQLLSALSYLRARHIHHRDIKDENIVIDRQLRIKLIDFGSAVIASPKSQFKNFRGTACYAPPEALMGMSYSGELADTWSMGILLHTLLIGQSPFHSIQQALSKSYYSPITCSPSLANLLQGLLEKDPLHRMNLIQIVSHPFFCNPVISA